MKKLLETAHLPDVPSHLPPIDNAGYIPSTLQCQSNPCRISEPDFNLKSNVNAFSQPVLKHEFKNLHILRIH